MVTALWKRRKEAARDGILFASFTGQLLDPSNVINSIAEAMDAVGYGWDTSHVFRKTVGTVIDEAGLSPPRSPTSSATPVRPRSVTTASAG